MNEPSIQWMDGALVGAGSPWQLVMKELLVVCTLLVQGLARDNETSTMGKFTLFTTNQFPLYCTIWLVTK
jgi:hypothetical protein